MMKALSLSIATVAVLALAGCAGKNTTKPTTTTPSVNNPTTTASVRHFSCDAGVDVAVKYLGNSQIELTTSPDVKRAVFSQAVSGSGERYVGNTGLWGNGGEWHQKGNQANFSYVGVHGGAMKSTVCTAN